MHGLLLSGRCLLAAVFLVAAVGKLLDLQGSRTAVEEFGVPPRLARAGGTLLPLAELAVGVALLIRQSAVAGAAGGLLLLIGFIAGIGRAMAQGRAPECHCFGQIHSEPAGPATLMRNAVLAAPAVLILAEGSGPSLTRALSALNPDQIALVAVSVLAAGLALAVAALWGQTRTLRQELARTIAAKQPPGLPRGAAAPDFSLTPVRGSAGTLGELRRPAQPTVLVFLSTRCVPCLNMLGTLADWQESLAHSVSLPAVFSGPAEEIESLAAEWGLGVVLAQTGSEVFGLYGLRATPSGVLIDADGLIASTPAQGVPAIEALIRSAASSFGTAELAVSRSPGSRG